jgi:hypothetical protein
MRRVIAALVVVGLAVAVIVFWPRDDSDDPPDTGAVGSTTTIPPATTTTSAGSDTTTTSALQIREVETVEQAEAILRELWFGWFEGIYNQDEDRIREVVVLEETVETARESFGTMSFSDRPALEDIQLANSELLRSDSDCLAVLADLDVSRFRPDATGTSGVYVMRRVDSRWKLLSVWPKQDDLWEADCDSRLS